jgi:hypothetical protein
MLLQDLRYALRMLRKHPGFTVVAVLTLALGIGANAAIFTLTDAVLLQSLPVRAPDQLATIATYDPKSADTNDSFSYPMYQDLRDQNDVFSGILARGGAQMNVSYEGLNDRIRGELVSGNYFEVLGVRPWAGRLFTADDDRTPGAHPVADALAGHPVANRAYAWSSLFEDGKRRFFAVLRIYPIKSPLDAVRAAIAAERQAKR